VWTLDELVDRVRAALATEYPGAPNGRVRDVPDRRAIRWYTTRGLVDRPIAMRGRVALYGPRHLLQLVALKRRQAEGRTLAEIQSELTGAPDATLAQVARVPENLLDRPATVEMDVVRPRFWAAAGVVDPALAEHRSALSASPPPRRPLLARATDAAPPAAAPRAVSEAAATPPPAESGRDADSVSVLAGVPLAGGVVLLLDGSPTPDDLVAIRAAAQPLVDLLNSRGLLDPAHGPLTPRSPS
jgi:DNA-binding transcriptional MerR regulator